MGRTRTHADIARDPENTEIRGGTNAALDHCKKNVAQRMRAIGTTAEEMNQDVQDDAGVANSKQESPQESDAQGISAMGTSAEGGHTDVHDGAEVRWVVPTHHTQCIYEHVV